MFLKFRKIFNTRCMLFSQLFLGFKIKISKIGPFIEPDLNLLHNFVHKCFYNKTTADPYSWNAQTYF